MKIAWGGLMVYLEVNYDNSAKLYLTAEEAKKYQTALSDCGYSISSNVKGDLFSVTLSKSIVDRASYVVSVE